MFLHSHEEIRPPGEKRKLPAGQFHRFPIRLKMTGGKARQVSAYVAVLILVSCRLFKVYRVLKTHPFV